MRIILTQNLKDALRNKGVESLLHVGAQVPGDTLLEAPCSLKWVDAHYKLKISAFSYCVSGYLFDVEIGRYTSIGESVQMGRGDHPIKWISTSPFFYLGGIFDVGRDFVGAEEYSKFAPKVESFDSIPGARTICIENDVWIGHGSFIRPGITIGTGSIVAAQSVVTKDVPPYAIIGGNPAKIIKYRFPEEVIARLLATGWWTRAPWQLEGLDISRPLENIEAIERRIVETEPYEPGFIDVAALDGSSS